MQLRLTRVLGRTDLYMSPAQIMERIRRTPARGRRARVPLVRLLVAMLFVAGAVAGCARYYWARPSGTAVEFDRDSRECAREAAPGSVRGEYVVFHTEAYRTCLVSRGWVREKQWDPPPAGWFRGLE